VPAFAHSSAVPERYQGVWRREWIVRSDGRRDDTSAVYWLQSRRFHVDLRVPAFTNPLGVFDGFAGVTTVTNNICQWNSELQMSPSATPDVGVMSFVSDDELYEDAIDGTYRERWSRVTPGDTDVLGFRCQLVGVSSREAHVNSLAYVVFCGDYVGIARQVAPLDLVEIFVGQLSKDSGECYSTIASSFESSARTIRFGQPWRSLLESPPLELEFALDQQHYFASSLINDS
jgi:hypothetical protein